MRYLIDTDRVIEYLKGRERAVTLIDPLLQSGHQVAISLITYGEIYEGIYFGRDPRQAERGFLRFLHGVDVLPLNRSIMRRYAAVRGNLRRRGVMIGDADLLIAATALHHEMALITGNLEHFRRIPELVFHPSTDAK